MAHGGLAATGKESGSRRAERWPRGEGLGFSDGAKRWDRHPVSALTGKLLEWRCWCENGEPVPALRGGGFIRATGSALVGITFVVVTFQEHSAGSFRRTACGSDLGGELGTSFECPPT